MTTQEALTILHCPDAYGGISGQAYGQALHMAITALRAWKGVQTDILENIQGFTMSGRAYVCVSDVAEIITKHLAEVEQA